VKVTVRGGVFLGHDDDVAQCGYAESNAVNNSQEAAVEELTMGYFRDMFKRRSRAATGCCAGAKQEVRTFGSYENIA
jgi:hypothetical protein